MKDSMIEEFVGKAHNDLDRVKALIVDEPTLANSSFAWGGTDWETALGAASHTGRKDIAEFLLNNGAHMDIFAAAMLGHLDVVRAIMLQQPNALSTPGPHGISLIAHAEAGGESATDVLEFLKSQK